MKTKLLAGIITIAVMAGAAAFAGTAPDIIWSRTGLGGYAYAAAVDFSGNVFVTGKTPTNSVIDMQTVKYDANGNEKWIRLYDSTGVDRGFGIAVSPLGDVYAVGQQGSATFPDFSLVKYDTNGNQEWAEAFNGGNADFGMAVAVDGSGTVCITGYSSVTGVNNIRTIRYDDAPHILTNTLYSDGGNCYGYAIAADKAGNSYVGGLQGSEYYLVKYDNNGASVWHASYSGGIWNEIRGVAVDSSGRVYVTGFVQSVTEIWVQTIKYDSIGNLEWSRSYRIGSDDEGRAICVDSSGNVYVAGFTTDSTPQKDFLLLKYDGSGNLCWATVFGSSYDDELHGAAMGPDGNLVVAGFTETAILVAYYQTIKFHTALSPSTISVDSGKILAAPNSLDLSQPSSEAVFHVTGNPGAQTELRLYDSAGRCAGTAKVLLDAGGRGRISYGRDGWGGYRPAPGAYWIVATGGGVNGRKIFFVIPGRK